MGLLEEVERVLEHILGDAEDVAEARVGADLRQGAHRARLGALDALDLHELTGGSKGLGGGSRLEPEVAPERVEAVPLLHGTGVVVEAPGQRRRGRALEMRRLHGVVEAVAEGLVCPHLEAVHLAHRVEGRPGRSGRGGVRREGRGAATGDDVVAELKLECLHAPVELGGSGGPREEGLRGVGHHEVRVGVRELPEDAHVAGCRSAEGLLGGGLEGARHVGVGHLVHVVIEVGSRGLEGLVVGVRGHLLDERVVLLRGRRCGVPGRDARLPVEGTREPGDAQVAVNALCLEVVARDAVHGGHDARALPREPRDVVSDHDLARAGLGGLLGRGLHALPATLVVLLELLAARALLAVKRRDVMEAGALLAEADLLALDGHARELDAALADLVALVVGPEAREVGLALLCLADGGPHGALLRGAGDRRALDGRDRLGGVV